MNAVLRRAVATLLALATVFALMPALVVPGPARAASGICSLGAGKDGAAGTLSGAYNTYYQPPVGTLVAGSTTINLGTMDTSNGGASTAVSANDLLLIIQMQDGTFSSTNSSGYGSGGARGTGLTSLGQAGLYEYVSVATVSGSTATILGAGANGGLINSYVEAAASGSSGQKTYQIVRVPQYTTATLSSTFHAAYWDGKTGGVAALDIASTLNLGGANVYATGDGFRGGGLTKATTSPAAVLNTDWVDSATMNGTATLPAFGSKGEGVVGSPSNYFVYTNFSTPSTPASPTVVNPGTQSDGYPGGDMGRGAPGNAGGGGTDEDPVSNDQNTGGGGGANGGSGGNGGFPWTPNYSGNVAEYSNPGVHTATGYATTNTADVGGRGGSALTPSVSRVFMGGGGGAGSNNNGSNNNGSNAYGSSGGVGGGIVMMRIANTSGTAATVYANGTTGLAPDNDGGGGGGAGGTVVITSPNAFTGITVHADGAAGTTAAATSSDTAITIQHGPGGGGGGGAVLTSSPVTYTVNAGPNGTTVSGLNSSYGATSGTSGVYQSITADSIPGVLSGAECYSASNGIFNGSVGAYSAVGSYDGVVATNDDDDFTARGFTPTGTPTNSGTTPGAWVGNTLGGPTPVYVQNEVQYNNTAAVARTITLSATAPTTPAGWTVQICPTKTCAVTAGWTIGSAGATSSSTYSVPARTNAVVDYYAVYSAPPGVVAYARYDATITATYNTASNSTHNELYPGFVVLTKSVAVQSTGCSPGQTPGTTGACPGGVLLYTIDYRNIVAGGASEAGIPNALPAAGSLVITENGVTAGWAANTNGLNDVLVAGANGTTTFGATTAGSTFTGNSVGSTSFTCTVGGASGSLVPAGLPGVSQGTITFRVTVK